MSIVPVPVKTAKDQEKLATLAGQIWREYWPGLIGTAQTEYMVEKFQSFAAIQRDMEKNNYEYWFLYANGTSLTSEEEAARSWGRIVGFTGGHEDVETNRFFISKIYLSNDMRGRGFARRVIEFYTALCRVRDLRAMYLTVNKYNELGIRAYKGTGFKVIDSVELSIGDGFVMDDFIMEKQA